MPHWLGWAFGGLGWEGSVEARTHIYVIVEAQVGAHTGCTHWALTSAICDSQKRNFCNTYIWAKSEIHAGMFMGESDVKNV